MTGPYQRAIEHLARTYEQDSPAYSGAFELAISTFPAYLPAEIAKDVMRQRRYNALPPIAERRALFIQQAESGRMFVNEHGRRSEIIGISPDSAQVLERYRDDPEHYPKYDVMVYWSDAEPSQDQMIWHSVGQPETRSPIIIDPALFVDLARRDKGAANRGQ